MLYVVYRAQSADIPPCKKPKMDLPAAGREGNSKLVRAELEQVRREVQSYIQYFQSLQY